MTRITLKEDNGARRLRVNGRLIAINGRIGTIAKVGNGHWAGIAGGVAFELVGGKQSGGASNEWHVYWPVGYGDRWVQANSAISAAKHIESC